MGLKKVANRCCRILVIGGCKIQILLFSTESEQCVQLFDERSSRKKRFQLSVSLYQLANIDKFEP